MLIGFIMEKTPLTNYRFINYFLPKVKSQTRDKFQKLSGGKQARVIAKAIFSKSDTQEVELDALIEHHLTEPPIEAEEVEEVAEKALGGEKLEEEVTEEIEGEAEPEEGLEQEETKKVIKKYKNRGFKFSKSPFGPMILVDKGVVKAAKSKGGGGKDGFFRIARASTTSLGRKKGSGSGKKLKSKLGSFKSGGQTFKLSDRNLSSKIRKAFPGTQNVGKRETAATKANLYRYRALSKTIKRPIALHTYTRRPSPVFKNRVILISPKGVKGSPVNVVAASYPTTRKGIGGSRSLPASRSMSAPVKRFVKSLPWAKLVAPNALRKIGPRMRPAKPWALPKVKLKGKGGGKAKKIRRAERKGTGAVKLETTHDIFATQKQKYTGPIGPEVLIFDAGFMLPGQLDGYWQIVEELNVDPVELNAILQDIEIEPPKGDQNTEIYEIIQGLDLTSDHLDEELIQTFPGVENRPERMIASLIVNYIRYHALSEILEQPINLTVIERSDEEKELEPVDPSPIPVPWQETPHEDGISIAIPTYPITLSA